MSHRADQIQCSADAMEPAPSRSARIQLFIKSCRERFRLRRCKGAGSTCAKILLILVNLTFLVTGVALVILGVWVHMYRDTLFYTHLLRVNQSASHVTSPATSAEPSSPAVAAVLSSPSMSQPYDVISVDNSPFLLIIAGCCVTTVGFLGCCGAYAESVCFLGFYSVLTVFVVVVEITLIAVSSDVKHNFSTKLLTNLQHQIQYRYNATAKRTNRTDSELYTLTMAWNTLQVYLNCCGANGPQDYLYSAWFNHTRDFTGVFVPPTCCQLTDHNPSRPEVKDENLCQVEAIVNRGETDRPITQLHTQGCHEALTQWVNGYEHVVISLLCNIVLLQSVNVVFACLLINWIRKKQSDYSWCDIEEYQ